MSFTLPSGGFLHHWTMVALSQQQIHTALPPFLFNAPFLSVVITHTCVALNYVSSLKALGGYYGKQH
jgi:hypothetical protein